GLPVIFTLNHLAEITEVDYRTLRATVERKREWANYRMFAIKKRSGGRRHIHAVSGKLFSVQQFINSEILQRIPSHPNSFAFHRDGGIRSCAASHCGARWLFQYDLTDFFYDVTEVDVYRIFVSLGYRNLLSFELSRLCTTVRLPKRLEHQNRLLFIRRVPDDMPYRTLPLTGVLPQGAPTSPMLSNLAAKALDESLSAFALNNGFVYTRYADDITLSTVNLSRDKSIGEIHRQVVHMIHRSGFRANRKKTRIAGPGSRKVVLGLLVDGDIPRLSKEMYKRIDRHLHAAVKYGLAETAEHEGFESAFGLYNHLSGLVAFVKDVDTERWREFQGRMTEIVCPWDN
ncbi:MAG TPA: reverse transcriptase family protein, partial [Candidatus Hydrogenedentes bacterium]|nr:reverse transcriptase family protein [Candidatus Hydrogenedentota bacterium]